jgi:hypothetical protein
MELENTNFDNIHFARASFPNEFAVFTLGSTHIQHVGGNVCNYTVENISEVIEDYSRLNTRLEIPLSSEMLPGIMPLEVEAVSDNESEILRKFIPNWKQIGSYLIRLDSIKLPSIDLGGTDSTNVLRYFTLTP